MSALRFLLPFHSVQIPAWPKIAAPILIVFDTYLVMFIATKGSVRERWISLHTSQPFGCLRCLRVACAKDAVRSAFLG